MLGGSLRVEGGDETVEGQPLRSRVLFVADVEARAARQANKKHSKKSIRQLEQVERREERTANKKWDQDKPCCCEKSFKLHGVHCCFAYTDILVFRLRQYFNSLSDSNQRAFIVERMLTTKDLSDVPCRRLLQHHSGGVFVIYKHPNVVLSLRLQSDIK